MTQLPSLKKITTDYDPKLGTSPLNFREEVRYIPDKLQGILDDSQIRGIELWESEYDAISTICFSTTWVNHGSGDLPKIMVDDPDGGVLCIEKGHVTMIAKDFMNGWWDVEEYKKELLKFPKLQYAFLYVGFMDEEQPCPAPDWLKTIAKRVEWEYNYWR